MIKRTSEQWQRMKPDRKVLDPDGWDRKNFDYSWFKQEITEEEYDQRVSRSTVAIRRPLIYAPEVG